MKKLLLSLSLALLLAVLPSCSKSGNSVDTNSNQLGEIAMNDVQNNDAETNNYINNSTVNTNPNEEMIKKMKDINYNSFELEVDYPNDKDYDAEIKVRNNQVKAKLEDELAGVELFGEDAFNHIYPLIKTLNIDRNTNKQDAINDVLKVFNLDNNYEKLELEIVLSDGMKIEFKDKQ